jgi:GntR family transcriptional regulator
VRTLGGRNAEKGISRYYQLYELLSGALRDGTIAPGSALPSEPTLCVQYGVSRTTVRRALERLAREGRISRRRGSGTYARPATTSRPSIDLCRLDDSQPAVDSHTTLSTRQAGPAPVPQALRALGNGIGPSAYLLESVRRDRAGPVALTAAYFPENIPARVRRGLLGRASIVSILGRLGRAAAPVSCSLGAVPADRAAARALEVPLGSPLLRVRTVLADRGGRVTAVLESLCRSDRMRLRSAVRR